MGLPDGVKRAVIDGHSHIGAIEAWPFYGIDYPVKPTVYDFSGTKEYLAYMDKYGIERSLAISNYGIPKPEQPFSLNPIVMEAATSSDRIRGLLWVSFLPRDREHTLEALKHAGEAGIVGLKTTFLLAGTRTQPSGTKRPRRSPTFALTPARSMTTSSTSTHLRVETPTSTTSSRWSRSTASAARSTSSTSAAA